MITLFRLYRIKAKQIKYRLMFWKLVDQVFIEIAKNPEKFEKKLTDSVVRLIVGNNTVNNGEIKA